MSMPAFGGTNTPMFGSTSSPAFGCTGTAFVVSTATEFGVGGPYGASSMPICGSSSTSTFGTSSTPAFGTSSTLAFGGSSTPSFSFGPAPTFGQSTSAFSTSPFVSFHAGFQSTAPASGSAGVEQLDFGGQWGGSRVASYTATTEADGFTSGQIGKLESISAMPFYKDKSHEEIRLVDYQLGDKGGPLPSGQSTGLGGLSSSATQTNTFSLPSAFGQSSSNPFSSSISFNPFALKSSTFSTAFGTSASAFSSSDFGASTSVTTPIFSPSTSAPSPGFSQSPSLFSFAPAHGASPVSSNINCSNTQTSQLFNSRALTIAQTGSQSTALAFGSAGFGQSDFVGQRYGSRVTRYTPTTEADGGTSGQIRKLESISAMPIYNNKSHEELRWEDYQLGDGVQIGGPFSYGQSTDLGGFCSSTTQTNTFALPSAFGQSSANAFISSISSNPFTPKSSNFSTRFGASASASSSSGFGASTSATAPFIFAPSTSAFVAYSSTPPGFGQSPSLFSSAPSQGTSPFNSNIDFSITKSFQLFNSTAPTSAQTGFQSTAPAFECTSVGLSGFVGQLYGSRVTRCTSTTEADGGTSGQIGKLECISAMPRYIDKSLEELRWVDYQMGDKGGPFPSGLATGRLGFWGQRRGSSVASYIATTEADGGTSGHNGKLDSISAMPIYKDKIHEELRWEDYQLGGKGGTLPFGQSTGLGGFYSSTTQTNTFSLPSAFGALSANAFSTSISSNSFAPKSSTLSTGFGTSASAFSSSGFGASISATAPSVFAPSTFAVVADSSPSHGFGLSSSLFSSSRAQGTSPFSSNIDFNNSKSSELFNCTAPTAWTGSAFGETPSPFGQTTSAFIQLGLFDAPSSVFSSSASLTSSNLTNFGQTKATDRLAPVGLSSLLTSRHLSQGWIGFPVRKYHPKIDGLKLPFLSVDEDTPTTPKADVLVVPRENPRVLFICPEQSSASASSEKDLSFKDLYTTVIGNDTPAENGLDKEKVQPNRLEPALNGINGDHSLQKEDVCMTVSGQRDGEAAIVYEHGAETDELMPKLQCSDYYTEPWVQELATKERADPGFCSHVKDFVVGRHGYGSIKFLGETDVRRLDLESLVQFNYREVIVYVDDTKKPPVGQGLNKPAEVTLLNIKCFDKKTGQQYTEGPKIEKYKEMLKREAMDQGAEFLSYDPTKGEWKIRVSHFNR